MVKIPTDFYGTYGLNRVIGKGSYGLVCSLKHDKTRVIKFTKENPFNRGNKQFFSNKCDNILYYESAMYVDSHDLWVITYKRAFADLYRYLAYTRNNIISIFSIATKLINAISHIHSLGMVHFDISAGNILLFDNYKTIHHDVKLSDFDFLSKIETGNIIEYDTFDHELVTVQYRPPELLFPSRKKICGAFTDIWSFCIVLVELIFNRHPFLRYLYDPRDSPIRNEYKCTADDVTINKCRCKKCHVKNHIEDLIGNFNINDNTFMSANDANDCKLIVHVRNHLNLLCDSAKFSDEKKQQIIDTLIEVIKNIIFSEPEKRPTAHSLHVTLVSLTSSFGIAID